mgnify:CR=1 FL=1
MAKEEKEKKTKGQKKATNKKEQMKKARKIEREAINNEKLKLEEKIDSLLDERKATKDKQEKKEITAKIKELKYQRSRVGKKDTFFSDVAAEMRLVRWPSAKEVTKYSIATLVFVLFFALFFFGFDALFALVKDLIN